MGKQLQVRNNFSPNLPKVQCRLMPAASAECRFVKKDTKTGAVTVSGYAVKWDSINYYGEKFLKGAFADVCAAFAAGTKKVHNYYNHGWRLWFIDSQIAMRTGKFKVIKEDDVGLYVEVELTPGLPIADSVAAMVQHGTVDGFSIAFYPPSDLDIEDKGTHIEIKRADLYEISIVDEPADGAARIINDDSINAIESGDDATELLRSILPGGYAEKLMARLADVNQHKVPEAPKKDPFAFLDSYQV
ncbi:HK97 family phage prohead protease [Acinetobacter nosocomialis]|uniref:HK97 family phage prohead protease n=1 Tax=Acinetobacter nosocomialis TaxID=106654 RepID=UPI001250A1C5|nr:HK97 family phage prohead protease [Acinetobacter nosocomialis]